MTYALLGGFVVLFLIVAYLSRRLDALGRETAGYALQVTQHVLELETRVRVLEQQQKG